MCFLTAWRLLMKRNLGGVKYIIIYGLDAPIEQVGHAYLLSTQPVELLSEQTCLFLYTGSPPILLIRPIHPFGPSIIQTPANAQRFASGLTVQLAHCRC
jgi:hypothetical protein